MQLERVRKVAEEKSADNAAGTYPAGIPSRCYRGCRVREEARRAGPARDIKGCCAAATAAASRFGAGVWDVYKGEEN